MSRVDELRDLFLMRWVPTSVEVREWRQSLNSLIEAARQEGRDEAGLDYEDYKMVLRHCAAIYEWATACDCTTTCVACPHCPDCAKGGT